MTTKPGPEPGFFMRVQKCPLFAGNHKIARFEAHRLKRKATSIAQEPRSRPGGYHGAAQSRNWRSYLLGWYQVALSIDRGIPGRQIGGSAG
jgi:hypothetical protein